MNCHCGQCECYVVGELADTSSGAEFRAAIDAALAAQGGE